MWHSVAVPYLRLDSRSDGFLHFDLRLRIRRWVRGSFSHRTRPHSLERRQARCLIVRKLTETRIELFLKLVVHVLQEVSFRDMAVRSIGTGSSNTAPLTRLSENGAGIRTPSLTPGLALVKNS